MAPRIPHAVQRALDDFPGTTIVRAQQIARDREELRRRPRQYPAYAEKWFVQ